MSIIVIGLNHKTAPVEMRERFAFGDGSLSEALQRLRTAGLAEEAVILSTCNRVEIYAVAPAGSGCCSARIRQFLLDDRNYDGSVGAALYEKEEPESVRHLFRVACGLDSMVLGETEVLGQLKKAYDTALREGHTGARLNRAFQRAFQVAKQVRSETAIQRGSVSVGSVAVELAEKIFDKLHGRDVMVIGAGDTSEKTARALMSRGARSLIVANRSFDRATVLAEQLGGQAVHWDRWSRESERVDIIISSTAAPRYIIDRAKLEPLMKLRRNRPLLLVDIAVPRDIDPEVNFLEGVYLYNIDHLQAIANDYLRQREVEIARCEAIIEEKIAALRESGARRRCLEPPAEPAFGPG